MIKDLSQTKIFIQPGYTDMRKQIDGLAVLVSQQLGKDPLDGSLYLFCGRGAHRLKILYWDKNGFCLWQKRLEQARFPWPRQAGEVRNISVEQLNWLLSGIDFWNAHQRVEYRFVG